MSYYLKVLQPNENVLYNEKIHWTVFVRAFIISALWAAPFLSVPLSHHERLVSLGFVSLVSLYLFASAWIRRATTEIVVTDRRIIFKRGLLFRETMEMNMNKVETVDVSQSIFGRLLGYGTVFIRGAGSTYAPLFNVAHPLNLRNSIIVR